MIEQLRIVNPLPQALGYYALQLEETLARIGVEARPAQCHAVERGEVHSALRMTAGSIANIASLRGGPSIQLWPSLGLVEGRIWSHGDFVVFHDPVPIRRQRGYGKIAAALARAPRLSGPGPTLVAHSVDAAEATRKIFPSARIELAYLPVSTNPQPASRAIDGPPRVLVAGQYKPTRDVQLLQRLGPLLAAKGFEPVIVGRGWPHVSGWSIRSEFVSEHELECEISSAAVLVVPYTRYFQSAVALRALELGTPVALAANSFAAHVLGEDPGLFSSTDSVAVVAESIEDALSGQDVNSVFGRYRRAADASWASLVESR